MLSKNAYFYIFFLETIPLKFNIAFIAIIIKVRKSFYKCFYECCSQMLQMNPYRCTDKKINLIKNLKMKFKK